MNVVDLIPSFGELLASRMCFKKQNEFFLNKPVFASLLALNEHISEVNIKIMKNIKKNNKQKKKINTTCVTPLLVWFFNHPFIIQNNLFEKTANL